MKCWCDLSWQEKCRIEDGEVNRLSYGSGYSFEVKTKVEKGQEQKERNDEKVPDNSC